MRQKSPKMIFNWHELNKNPIPHIESSKMTNKTILKLLEEADKAYHNGESVVSDTSYDAIVSYYEQKTGEKRESIGAPIPKGIKKVTLPLHMGSMDKVKPDSSKLKNWLKKFNGPFVVSDKLDGISLMIHYDGINKLPRIYTRGNGKVGTDATALRNYIKIPEFISEGPLFIRGELIIPKNDWESFEKNYNNPRNAVAGLVNGLVSAKKIKPTLLERLHFVVFDVVGSEKFGTTEQLSFAKEKGFETVYHESSDTISIETLSSILLDRRQNSNYEVDGIIVADDKYYAPTKSGNPKHAVAFKMVLDDQKAETTVTEVIWTVSKGGLLKPVVHFLTITISNTQISKASGYNAKWILDNKIGAGANVIVIKSGDVIPKIQTVTKGVEAALPDFVEWTWKGKTDIQVIGESKERKKKQILNFAAKLGFDGFRMGTINKIFPHGFDTFDKVLKLTVEDLLAMEGFQQKSAEKLVSSMRSNYGKSTNTDILAATNAFGEGIGRRRLEPLFEAIPNLLTTRMKPENLIEKIEMIDGFSNITAQKIVDQLTDAKAILKNLPKPSDYADYVNPVPVVSTHLINRNVSNMEFVFSGVRDKPLVEQLKMMGAKFPKSVKKSVSILIVKDASTSSKKVQTANNFGIKIMTLDEFTEWLRLN